MTRPLAVRTVVDALVVDLRARILQDHLPGGTVIAEGDLTSHYEVARPTARSAIERLVAEGLLIRDAHRSAHVPLLNSTDIIDLYQARSYLEESAMRHLATGPTPPAAHTALEHMEHAENHAQFVDHDIAFHRALIDSLGNTRLSHMHQRLLQETRLCMAQTHLHLLLSPQTILAEHRAILDAVTAADPERASEAVRIHLDLACTALVRHLDRGHH